VKNSYWRSCASICVAALAFTQPVRCQTVTQTLSVALGANGKISVPSSITLTRSASTFSNYTGTLSGIQYKIRTTTSSGSGTITVKASSDFTPTTGPSVSSGDLAYNCGASSQGTPCSGQQTVSTTSGTPVVSFGSGVCSGASPCAGPNPSTTSITLTLLNSPVFKSGLYSAQLMFTVSAI
jgi:hypothetical protein